MNNEAAFGYGAYLEPPQRELEEQSLAAAFRPLVDDLFTYESVAARLNGREDDPRLQALVNQHKFLLIEHLQETAWQGVAAFLDRLDEQEAQPGLFEPGTAPDRDGETIHRVD